MSYDAETQIEQSIPNITGFDRLATESCEGAGVKRIQGKKPCASLINTVLYRLISPREGREGVMVVIPENGKRLARFGLPI